MREASDDGDGVVRALLPEARLRVAVVVCTAAARTARRLHHLRPVSAALLGQGLAAGALLAALTKDEGRLNLQLECDGPLRGLFVDASGRGELRGYVKNPGVDLEGTGAFRWRPALGNSGFLSVLKDPGHGEPYRSSVQLTAHSLAADLNHYFELSDQVATHVGLEVRADAEEPLGAVAGVLLQALPDGDLAELRRRAEGLDAALASALAARPRGARALLQALFPGAEVLAAGPAVWRCACSKQRVLDAIGSLGRAEVQAILDEQGQAAVECQFCRTRHVATRADLEQLLAAAKPPRPAS